jgi:hypothetical protein
MSELEVQGIIISTLQQLQAGLGSGPTEITQAMKPLTDLAFFDSLLGIETTMVLEEKLGCSCDADTIFKDKRTGEPLTIAQIALLLSIISKPVA